MRVLVVGGAGYIGSHALRLLARAGHLVWAYDNLTDGHRAAVPPGLLIEGDLHDGARLENVLREHSIEAVMHFAAYAQVGESMLDPARYYHNNIAGTLSLLEAMRRAGVTRIVFSSTTATYGAPRTMPITEDEPQRPINPYGFTKMVAEQALQDYARAYGFATAALRYFNAAGASLDGGIGEAHTPESHLIPNVLKVALGQASRLVIHGNDYPTADGTCVRDYVHVDDLADAHLRALDALRPGAALQLNLGSGTGYSVQQVLDACRVVTGHAIDAVVGPRRPGDPPILVADASRANALLGWSASRSDLHTIVSSAWQWHRSHPDGYGDSAGASAPARQSQELA